MIPEIGPMRGAEVWRRGLAEKRLREATALASADLCARIVDAVKAASSGAGDGTLLGYSDSLRVALSQGDAGAVSVLVWSESEEVEVDDVSGIMDRAVIRYMRGGTMSKPFALDSVPEGESGDPILQLASEQEVESCRRLRPGSRVKLPLKVREDISFAVARLESGVEVKAHRVWRAAVRSVKEEIPRVRSALVRYVSTGATSGFDLAGVDPSAPSNAAFSDVLIRAIEQSTGR
jgi:hypothetical protein